MQWIAVAYRLRPAYRGDIATGWPVKFPPCPRQWPRTRRGILEVVGKRLAHDPTDGFHGLGANAFGIGQGVRFGVQDRFDGAEAIKQGLGLGPWRDRYRECLAAGGAGPDVCPWAFRPRSGGRGAPAGRRSAAPPAAPHRPSAGRSRLGPTGRGGPTVSGAEALPRYQENFAERNFIAS